MSKMPRRCVLVSMVAVAALLGPATAGADDVVIRMAPPALIPFMEVDEGETAVFELQFFNGSGETIFNPVPARIANGIDFDVGDRNDEAFDTRIANNLCAGVPQLLTGVGCLFDLEVLTRDQNPMPPVDHADWLVRVGGFYETINPVTLEREDQFVALTGIVVRIHDPLPADEPAYLSVASLIAGVVLLFLDGRRRRQTLPRH